MNNNRLYDRPTNFHGLYVKVTRTTVILRNDFGTSCFYSRFNCSPQNGVFKNDLPAQCTGCGSSLESLFSVLEPVYT